MGNDTKTFARISVDKETSEFLERITDQLQDAMVDFVKTDELARLIVESEKRVSHEIKVIGDAITAEVLRQIIASTFETVKKTDLEQSLRDVNSQTSNAVTGLIESLTDMLAQGLKETKCSIIDNITNQVDAKHSNIHNSLNAIESHLAALSAQIADMNRPWWKKILS
ncbi:MAG: hypothetical protein WCG52_09655 [bacterium]